MTRLLTRVRPLLAFAFGIYAGTLVVLTHWPGVTIEGPVARPDLYLHFVAFGVWTLLITGSAFFGPALSRRNIARSTAVALLYALVDEVTQGLPGVNRSVDPTDMAANAGGILLATALLLVLAQAATRRGAAGTQSRVST